MSGNKCIKSAATDVNLLAECLKEAFPNLAANWEELLDPKKGNIAKTGEPLIPIGDRSSFYNTGRDDKANVRLPSHIMGSGWDMGLYQDPELGTWGLVGCEEDMNSRRGPGVKIMKAWDAAKVKYAEKDLLQKASSKGMSFAGATDIDSTSMPKHLAGKVAPGKIRRVRLTVDSDLLRDLGVQIKGEGRTI
ncbi:MAG: hypothetical protein M0R32_06820 [Candidatus Cloacimonetes bacterium]|jgi:hypothetical protein|nr:hypothetical protein [Candidatus Cloacimonadota bacterium]